MENLRLRQKQASEKYREKLKLKRLSNHPTSTYSCRQTLAKAVHRTLRTLPKDPQKRNHVVYHIAQSLDIIPKTTEKHKREQRSLPMETKKSCFTILQS